MSGKPAEAVYPRRSRWLGLSSRNPDGCETRAICKISPSLWENLPMRRFCIAMVGVVLVAAASTGCGGGNTTANPGSGFLDDSSNAVPFKSTDLTQFGDMQNQMKEKHEEAILTRKSQPRPRRRREVVVVIARPVPTQHRPSDQPPRHGMTDVTAGSGWCEAGRARSPAPSPQPPSRLETDGFASIRLGGGLKRDGMPRNPECD